MDEYHRFTADRPDHIMESWWAMRGRPESVQMGSSVLEPCKFCKQQSEHRMRFVGNEHRLREIQCQIVEGTRH
jgi:hypothetical protein